MQQQQTIYQDRSLFSHATGEEHKLPYSSSYDPVTGGHYKAFSDDMRQLQPKKFVNYAEKLNYFGTKKLIDQQEQPTMVAFQQPIQE